MVSAAICSHSVRLVSAGRRELTRKGRLSASGDARGQGETNAVPARRFGYPRLKQTRLKGQRSYHRSGINTGFGAVIGAGSKLYFDSDAVGAITMGLNLGGGVLGNRHDVCVIYLDTKPGGVSDTREINDAGPGRDAGRAAISGIDYEYLPRNSKLLFANGFEADYAIAIEEDYSGLFRINTDGSLTHIRTLTQRPVIDRYFREPFHCIEQDRLCSID